MRDGPTNPSLPGWRLPPAHGPCARNPRPRRRTRAAGWQTSSAFLSRRRSAPSPATARSAWPRAWRSTHPASCRKPLLLAASLVGGGAGSLRWKAASRPSSLHGSAAFAGHRGARMARGGEVLIVGRAESGWLIRARPGAPPDSGAHPRGARTRLKRERPLTRN